MSAPLFSCSKDGLRAYLVFENPVKAIAKFPAMIFFKIGSSNCAVFVLSSCMAIIRSSARSFSSCVSPIQQIVTRMIASKLSANLKYNGWCVPAVIFSTAAKQLR